MNAHTYIIWYHRNLRLTLTHTSIWRLFCSLLMFISWSNRYRSMWNVHMFNACKTNNHFFFKKKNIKWKIYIVRSTNKVSLNYIYITLKQKKVERREKKTTERIIKQKYLSLSTSHFVWTNCSIKLIIDFDQLAWMVDLCLPTIWLMVIKQIDKN